MRSSVYIWALFGLLATSVYTQSDDSSTESDTPASSGDESSPEGTGKVADTDTTKYAGVYEFTYFFSPNASTAKETTQLKCEERGGFTLDIPGAGGVDIARDFSGTKDGKDPVYNTNLGSWVVKELFKGAAFDMLKLNVFINDEDDKLVCWGIKKDGKNILVNLNPLKPESCPSRFIPSTKVCRRDTAYLMGVCKSGACTGDGSAARTTKSDPKDKSEAGSSASSAMTLSPLHGLTIASVITLAGMANV